MKIGLVLNTNDPETIWNSLRFGLTSLIDGNETKMFLLGKGVEIEDSSNERFDIKKQLDAFISKGGKILACGSCLRLRDKEGSEICPISSMSDLLELVKESDKVLVFG